MPLILGANSVSGYTVKNSLRFNHNSSDYLNRTPASAGNRRTFTFSFWTKRSKNNSSYPVLFDNGADSNNRDSFFFNEGGTPSTSILQFYCLSSSVVFLDLGTTQVFRDFSAWYHIVLAVDTTQATASNRVKLYINGSQVTSFITATYPSQNTDMNTNSTNPFKVGGSNATSFYYDGYLADYYFIDGQALTPSSFGSTDTDTGIWIPKAYTGTYGTNGFFLKFLNSASLGTDSSGNGNNFTVNNLTSIDQTTDTPTNNFCTMNSVDNLSFSGSGTLTQGNTNVTYTGGDFKTNATIAPNKGKWYWESKAVANTRQGTIGMRIGFQEIPNTFSGTGMVENASFGMLAHPSAGVYSVVNGSNVLRSASLTYVDGDIIGIALDLDSNISYWYKNGSLSVTYDFSGLSTINSKNIAPTFGNGSGSSSPEINANFGNPSITIVSGNSDANGYGNFEYAVPSGYYALCTKNLAQYG